MTESLLQHLSSSLQTQPTPSHSSSYLSGPSHREMNKQVVRHISVSAPRALPTTRLEGQQPLCTAEVMQILILTELERLVVVHFVATYHSFTASPEGEKKHKIKTKVKSLRVSDLSPLFKNRHRHFSAPKAMSTGRCF